MTKHSPGAAGPGRRVAAYGLDAGLLAGVLAGGQLALSALLGERWLAPRAGWPLAAWVWLTISLPSWLYFALAESGARQATPGKRWLRLRVARLDGRRLRGGRALLRTALKLLPWELAHLSLWLPEPLWAGGQGARPGLLAAYGLLAVYLLLAALTPRRQAPHDLAAGTMVTGASPSP